MKILKISVLCFLLTMVLVTCAPKATLFIEPVEEPKDFPFEHEILDLAAWSLPEFSYAKCLENKPTDWEEKLKEIGNFYADMPYTEQNITSVQQAVDYFYSLKEIEALKVPKDWVIYWIEYDREYDVWKVTAGDEGMEPWNFSGINDAVWVWYFRGNGQLLFSAWS